MTFPKIIESIESKLSKFNLQKNFKAVYDISLNDEERAYNLGLFFHKLEKDNHEIFIVIKNDIQNLKDYYYSKYLKEYFTLKTSKIISTRPAYWEYPLLIVGLVIIFLGVKRHIDGLYVTETNAMTQLPVYMTGLLGVLYGLTICVLVVAVMTRRRKLKKFYNHYIDN